MESASPAGPFSVETLLGRRAWLRALALSLVHDEHRAEDLVQQTWLRALERPPSRVESPDGWLATVVRNLARDGWRRDSRREERERARPLREPSPAAADLVARADAHRRVIREVLALREPYRTVVLTRFFEDQSPAEIAARTGVPAVTVRTRLHRALRILRDELDRREPGGWQLVVLPLLAGGAVKGSAVAALTGGLIVSAKKKLAVAGLVLLLALGGVWAVTTFQGGASPRQTAAAETGDDGAAPRDRDRVRLPPPEEPAASAAEPGKQEDRESSAQSQRVERLEVQVLRYLPFPEIQPEPQPKVGDGDERETVEIEGAGIVMDGEQQKWAPVPPQGTVTLRGRITDAKGNPLAGAKVLRVHLEEDGEPVMKMGWAYFTGAGPTGPDGRFELTNQPEGRWILQGDWHAWMRREHQLDLEGSRRIDAAAGETLEGLDFQIPVDPTQLGKVEVYTHDGEGKALGGSEVSLDNWSDWTNKKGRMTIPNREPGRYGCVIRAAGYKRVVREVHVRAGETTKLDVELTYALTGTLTLDGRLRDDDGDPVPNMEIFLGTGMDDSREVLTDADGNFHFEGLPQRMANSPVHVVSMPKWKVQLYTQARVETTVPHPGLELVCTQLTNMTIKVRDEETGDPLPLINANMRVVEVVDGTEQTRTIRSTSVYRENGNLELQVPRGRMQMTVEAKDHRGVEIEILVPDTDGPKEIEIHLRSM